MIAIQSHRFAAYAPRLSTAVTAALCLILASSLFGSAMANAQQRVEVIKPDIEQSDVRFDRIDSENFEISASLGLLAIEDFDTGFVSSLRLGYHFNERLFAEFSYSLSEGDKTSFEELSGTGADLISADDRKYKSWDLALGFNLLPGETWLFGRAFSSDFYTVLGAGRTDFGGSNWTTLMVGAGYRLYINDWLTLRTDIRDHIFNSDVVTDNDQTHNLEIAFGSSIFF